MMDLIDVKIALQLWNQDELGFCGKAFVILDRAPQTVSLADKLVEHRAPHADVLATGAVQALKSTVIEGVVPQPPSSRRAGSR